MLEGEGSICDTIKNEKLSTFVSNNKKANVTLNNLTVQIKHEKTLMNRLLVGSRTVMFKSGINKQKRIFQTSSLRSDRLLSNLLEKVYWYIY